MSRVGHNLFAELTANGSTATLAMPALANQVNVFLGEGNGYGAGTVIMESSPDGGTTWIAVPGASWTSGDGLLGSYFVFGQDVRFTISGSTTPTITLQVDYKAASMPEAVQRNAFADNGTPNIIFRRAPDLVVLMSEGTDGGGTLALQVSVDAGVTWYDCAAGITAAGLVEFDNSNLKARLFRAELTGSTTPTLVTWAMGANSYAGPKVLS